MPFAGSNPAPCTTMKPPEVPAIYAELLAFAADRLYAIHLNKNVPGSPDWGKKAIQWADETEKALFQIKIKHGLGKKANHE